MLSAKLLLLLALPTAAFEAYYADAARCHQQDELCRRVHTLEPDLPIRPPFDPEPHRNLCMAGTGFCLPRVTVISGFHMLDEAALGFLQELPQLEHRIGRKGHNCFGDWVDDIGAAYWTQGWGAVPVAMPGGDDRLIVAHW